MQRAVNTGRPARQLHLLAPLVAALLLIPFVVAIRYTADFGLAYHGGAEAWASGHPERVFSWFSTPFLALVMALVTRVISEQSGAHIFLGLDLLLWAALLLAVWNRLDGRVPSRLWWGTLVAAAVFSPGASSIFWLTFNLVAFGLALGGFVLIGRHDRLAGLLIGLSLAIKPILLLVPLVLLLRRESRSAGLWSIALAAGFSVAGLVFLAWRAGDWSAADPVAYLAAFAARGRGPLTACVVQNYSPVAFLCRLGLPTLTLVTLGIAAGGGVIGWLLAKRLQTGWELFAAACLLSPMIGPIEWASYQLLFAPLMLLLAYQFWAQGAPARMWVYLAGVYLMTEMVWDPFESLAGAPVVVLVVSYSIGQFAQYALIALWFWWLHMRPRDVTRA